MQTTTTSTRTIMKPTPLKVGPKKPLKDKLPKVPTMPRPNMPTMALPSANRQRLIIIVLAALTVFFFLQYRAADKKLHPAAQNAKQVTSLVGKVSKLAIVPTDETPSVATVKDVAKLKGQTFFALAQDGDKVLVYNKNKRAILYRPSTNQIVNIAPISLNASQTGQ